MPPYVVQWASVLLQLSESEDTRRGVQLKGAERLRWILMQMTGSGRKAVDAHLTRAFGQTVFHTPGKKFNLDHVLAGLNSLGQECDAYRSWAHIVAEISPRRCSEVGSEANVWIESDSGPALQFGPPSPPKRHCRTRPTVSEAFAAQ